MSKRILFDYLCNFQPNIFPYLHTFCNVGFRRKIFLYTIWSREWSSGKLVEYESLRVSNGRIQMGLVGLKMVKLRVDMQVYSIRFQFSIREYHAIIEIVECESVRIAQKWSSVSRICENVGTRSLPNLILSTRQFTDDCWNSIAWKNELTNRVLKDH